MTKGTTIIALLVVSGGIAQIAHMHQESEKLASDKAALMQAVVDFRASARNVSTVNPTQIPLALAAEKKALATLETKVKNSGFAEDGEIILKAAHDLDHITDMDALNNMAKAKLIRMAAASTTTPASH